MAFSGFLKAWRRFLESYSRGGMGHRYSGATVDHRNLLGTRMWLNELVAFSLLGPQRAVLWIHGHSNRNVCALRIC